MPRMSQHQSNNTTKMLLMGSSGSGKTGALCSLVRAGYKLIIVDCDNGLDVLKEFLTPEELDTIIFETFTDKMKTVNGKVLPDDTPTAFANALNALTKWEFYINTSGISKLGKKDDPSYYNLGNISDWDNNTILVIDSFTHLCLASMRHVLAINNRSGQQPYQSDWGEAMRYCEDLLALLYSTSVQCNVIVTSHITFIENEGEPVVGLPTALGQKLPPKVPSYFNTIILAQSTGSGESVKRKLYGKTQGVTQLKAPIHPDKLKSSYPIETGLADIFKLLRTSTPGKN